MKVLLTGFGPFGEADENPSQLIAQHLAAQPPHAGRLQLLTAVLPTVFETAGRRVRELLERHQPAAVLALGLSARREDVGLERFAVNVDDALLPDNSGQLRSGSRIVADGPAAYWSTLPLEAMLAALKARGIPASVSNHAGAYVCNHVFYTLRHELEMRGRGVPAGFVHVPALSEERPLSMLVDAVVVCLEVLLQEVKAPPVHPR